MLDRKTRVLLLRRRKDLRDWLTDQAPYSVADQKHLDSGTPEQAYWNYGYLAALSDVLGITAPALRTSHSAGMSSSSPSDGPDAVACKAGETRETARTPSRKPRAVRRKAGI